MAQRKRSAAAPKPNDYTFTTGLNRFGYCYTVRDENGIDIAYAGGFTSNAIAQLEAIAAMGRVAIKR